MEPQDSFAAHNHPAPAHENSNVKEPAVGTVGNSSPEETLMETDDHNDDAVQPNAAGFDRIDDETYDGPVFWNPNDQTVVEVPIDDNEDVIVDDEMSMDEDDDQDDTKDKNNDLFTNETNAAPDRSRVQLMSHTGPVYAVAAHRLEGSSSQASNLVIVSGGGDDKAYLHHITTPATAATTTTATSPITTHSQWLEHAHSDSVSCVALNLPFLSSTDAHPTPRLIAVGAFDGSLVLYHADTGTTFWTIDAGPSDIEWLCFHPKGGTVLLAGSATDATIWMYHVTLQRCLQVFVGHDQAVTAGAFSPDGKWALSASADGTVRIWAPKTGVCKHVFRLAPSSSTSQPPPASSSVPGVTCLATHGGTDGQLILVGTEDGQAHVCHLGTKKVVASLRHYELPTTPHATSGAAPDDEHDGDDDAAAVLELPMSVEAVGFASAAVNPHWCATGGVDGTLKIFDLANNGQCRQVCRLPSPPLSGDTMEEGGAGGGGITRLQWHPTLPLVVTASTTGIVAIWDARNGRLLQTLTGHTDTINDMTVQCSSSSNGGDGGNHTVIVTGSDDHSVRVFEVNVMELLQAAPATR